MNAVNFLSSPVADALGWTLLHALWQGFALILPAAVILHLLRNQSSALRYRVGVLTLLTQVVVSAATFAWHYTPAPTPLAIPVALTNGPAIPVRWQTLTQTLPWHQQIQQFLENHLSQFVLIYLIGVALFGLRLAGGWVYLQRLSQTASQPATIAWAHLTDQLRAILSIRVVIQVRESARITVPMVVGVLKPVLLLPIGLAIHLTTREVEAVLAHELAHVKRHDYAVNLLQSVVEVLYFFHPALWWLSARVREEREHCCDDLAVQACGGDGRILAQALAHVEELRLAQLETPMLAMAFASTRQQLLHRVRRMLGAPSRPFVSNGSLAGLTLATILLMSVSVYAVQHQTSPKPKKKHPGKVVYELGKDDAEFSITDNTKVDYVIWKGQKLPAKRVASLQHQLDLVMSGKLSLDTVKKSDRDILLAIIETNQSYSDELDKGLTETDYSTLAASALKNIPLSPDGTVEGLANVDYDGIIRDAFASISGTMPMLDSLKNKQAYRQRQMDSLSQLLAQRSQQAQAIRLQMEKLRFPIDEINRNSEVLNWRKDKLMEQRDALIEKHEQLLNNEGKQKLNQVEVEKQLTALEPQIKKLEASMEELNRQFETVNARQDEFKQPMQKLEQQAEQLDEQIEKLADEIGRHGDEVARVMVDPGSYVTVGIPAAPARPRRAPRAPASVRNLPGVIAPAAPLPPSPAPAPAGKTINIRGRATPAAKPASSLKSALAPKPARPEKPEQPEEPENE